MPTPDPVPTPEQLVIVGEIAMLSYSDVETMVSADSDQDVSDAKWARTIDDIDTWDDIRDEAGDIKKAGPIEFFEGIGSRLDFRNRVRSRYDQELLTSERQVEGLTALDVSSLRYF